jgi:ionotropic glutamate receptor
MHTQFQRRNLSNQSGPETQQASRKKLRIGVPSRFGFSEFTKVEWRSDHNDKPKISGFSIDLFLAVLDMLPFPLPYEFVPYVNQNRQSAGTYDDLLYQIKLKVIQFLVYYT